MPANPPATNVPSYSVFQFANSGGGGISGGMPGVAWWDLVMTVTANPVSGLGERINIMITAQNNTGATWKDFHISLGTGTGANFVVSNGDALSFDFSATNTTSPQFSKVTKNQGLSEEIWFTQGQVGNLQQGNFNFPLRIGPTAFNNGVAIFTLRQHATTSGIIPEPGTLSLLGLGGLMVASRRRLTR